MNYRTNRKRDGDGLLLQDRAVMELLLRGMSRGEICQALGMPLGTVNTCCTRIYRHTGCKSAVELILRHGAGHS